MGAEERRRGVCERASTPAPGLQGKVRVVHDAWISPCFTSVRPRGLMDKASDSGSGDCAFDSHRGYWVCCSSFYCSRYRPPLRFRRDSVTAGMADVDPCHSSPRTQEARMRHVGTLQSRGGLSTQEGVWGGAGGSVRLGRARSKRLLLCGARTRDIGLSSRIAHKTHALTTELIGGFDHQVR